MIKNPNNTVWVFISVDFPIFFERFNNMHTIPEYIPILTTIFSIYFFKEIFSHNQKKQTKYLLWWAIGVLTFGLGTLAESINVLFGWSEINFLRITYCISML